MTGVPIHMATANDFTMVRGALVKEMKSANDALVWTRIHWRWQVESGNAVTDADGVWWPGSIAKLSEETGLSFDQVRRSLERLVKNEYLRVRNHQLNGVSDRTRSYQPIIDESLWQSRQMATGTDANNPVAAVPNVPSIETSFKTPPIVPQEVALIDEPSLFEIAYKAWPKNSKKKVAERKWQTALKKFGGTEQELMITVRTFGEAYARSVTDVQYVPALEVWLNQERWEDDLPHPKSSGGSQSYGQLSEAAARLDEQMIAREAAQSADWSPRAVEA